MNKLVFRRLVVAAALIAAPLAFVSRASAEETLSWIDCVREAQKHHPDLISAAEQVSQDESAKRIAASGEYPQVDASAGASTSKSSGTPSQKNYSAGVTGNQMVYDGKKTINGVKAAGENIQAARQNFRFTSADVRSRLRVAFIGLLKSQEMMLIAKDIYEIRRGNLELITLRYQSGLEHRGALMTAEASLADARYGIAQARRSHEVAQCQLAKEMGREQWTALAAKGDFTVKDTAKGDLDLAALAQTNSQVRKAIAQKNAAEFNLKADYGDFAPSVSVNGSAFQAGKDLPPGQSQVSAGLTVTLPIFEGGLRKAKVAQAQALVRQLEADERSTRDSVQLTLEQDRSALIDALENVSVQQIALLAAEERSRVAQAQYSIGTITYDNWSIIEDNLVSAKRGYLNAQAVALLAEAEWARAKGETLEYEE